MLIVASPTVSPLSTTEPIPEGQSVVAVWQEWAEVPCDDPSCIHPDERARGAVVATVEVTGPSHHADEHVVEVYPRELAYNACTPDALPDCWHTPTSRSRRLDDPIPMEQPQGATMWWGSINA